MTDDAPGAGGRSKIKQQAHQLPHETDAAVLHSVARSINNSEGGYAIRKIGVIAAGVVGFGFGAVVGGTLDVVGATGSGEPVRPVIAGGFGLIGGCLLAWLVARLIPGDHEHSGEPTTASS